MRWLVIASLAACGGSGPPAGAPPSGPGPVPRTRADDRQGVDPIAALAPGADGEQVSWLVPGRAHLELGGTPIEDPGGDRPFEVGVIERHGGLVRAAVRLPHARFAVWTDRARLMSFLLRDHRIGTVGAHDPSRSIHAVLRAGARVRRLARKNGQTQVRFVGAVEVEGWVSDGILADTAPRRDPAVRIPSGRRTLLVIPGTVIRTEPRWAAQALATIADGHIVDVVREVDTAWIEASYADTDVSVYGFLSKRDPPGRVHRPRDPEIPPPAAVPNAKVASGTCLYARARGETVGYIVGDRDVALDDLGGGWWGLAIDTPWGAIAFAARGPAPGELVACAPPGSVPAPAGASPQPPVP